LGANFFLGMKKYAIYKIIELYYLFDTKTFLILKNVIVQRYNYYIFFINVNSFYNWNLEIVGSCWVLLFIYRTFISFDTI